MHWTERLYYLCRSESFEKPIEQVFPTWSSNIISNDEIHFRVHYVHVHCLKLLRKLYRATLFWGGFICMQLSQVQIRTNTL